MPSPHSAFSSYHLDLPALLGAPNNSGIFFLCPVLLLSPPAYRYVLKFYSRVSFLSVSPSIGMPMSQIRISNPSTISILQILWLSTYKFSPDFTTEIHTHGWCRKAFFKSRTETSDLRCHPVKPFIRPLPLKTSTKT